MGRAAVAVLPVTSRAGEGALYPPVAEGESGLRQVPWVWADQVPAPSDSRVVAIRSIGRCWSRSWLAAMR